MSNYTKQHETERSDYQVYLQEINAEITSRKHCSPEKTGVQLSNQELAEKRVKGVYDGSASQFRDN